MKYFFIILCAAIFLAIGYLLMDKLDRFISEINDSNAATDLEDKNYTDKQGRLNIALENPILAPSIASALESFSKEHPDFDMYFSSGTPEQIRDALACGKSDLGVFLTDSSNFWMPDGKGIQSVLIPLKQSSVFSPALGREIQPLGLGDKKIRIVWDGRNSNVELLSALWYNEPGSRGCCTAVR